MNTNTETRQVMDGTPEGISTAAGKGVSLTEAIAAVARQGARAIRKINQPQEWKLVSLRECPSPEEMQRCETSEQAAAYWNEHIRTHPFFNPECECLAVLILNTRRRIKGHCFVSLGSMDTILVHPREVFRLAVVASAACVIIMHNLCAATHNTIIHPAKLSHPRRISRSLAISFARDKSRRLMSGPCDRRKWKACFSSIPAILPVRWAPHPMQLGFMRIRERGSLLQK